MDRRIDAVEPMGQDTDGGQLMVKGGTVGSNVDAVCQPADDEHFGTKGLQVADKVVAELAAIVGGFAGAHQADNAQGIQIGIPLEEEHQRSIGTLAQAGGIASVADADDIDTALLRKLPFALGTTERIGTIELLQQPPLGRLGVVYQFVASGKHIGGIAKDIVQQAGADKAHTGNLLQSQAMKDFFRFNGVIHGK